jgi:hypothetical protein
VCKQILSDGFGPPVRVLNLRISKVMAEGDTFVAIDDDNMVLVEDEIVDKHWFSQDIFRRSRCSPGELPLALDSDWMFVSDD